ncbi:hypothetical protein SKAU_G00189560 [Synaphobranchus kaupii]|uniref:Uncharacterized protein n=1 Tax=Synaphobranchus kaupii TaxID=118154 RepID=A0A9Q1FDF0_SYNKA|nr:hypothetical protein SKAU_G00189560 [Synaphobranchus kaupii]
MATAACLPHHSLSLLKRAALFARRLAAPERPAEAERVEAPVFSCSRRVKFAQAFPGQKPALLFKPSPSKRSRFWALQRVVAAGRGRSLGRASSRPSVPPRAGRRPPRPAGNARRSSERPLPVLGSPRPTTSH